MLTVFGIIVISIIAFFLVLIGCRVVRGYLFSIKQLISLMIVMALIIAAITGIFLTVRSCHMSFNLLSANCINNKSDYVIVVIGALIGAVGAAFIDHH